MADLNPGLAALVAVTAQVVYVPGVGFAVKLVPLIEHVEPVTEKLIAPVPEPP